MREIILDISANTHKNDIDYFEKIVASVAEIDRRDNVIIFKTQLFKYAGDNIPTEHNFFDKAYKLCEDYDYMLTASVFDLFSLRFLLKYHVPFIKIACRPNLYWLSVGIPKTINTYLSFDSRVNIYPKLTIDNSSIKYFCCVPKYPAKKEEYKWQFSYNLSDHTVGLDLFYERRRKNLSRYECHYIIDQDPGNPDAGPFAKTPKMLKEILCV